MCGRARGTIGRFAHLSAPCAVAQEKSPFGQAVCCRSLANATLLSPGLTWSASACHFTCDFRDGLPLPGLPWCSALSVPCASPSSSSLSASSPLCLVLRHRHCAPWTASSERPGREGINFLRSSGSLSSQGHHADKAARTVEEEAKAGRRKEYGMARGPLWH